jgi:peptide/nickel transport system substrate-binding protein
LRAIEPATLAGNDLERLELTAFRSITLAAILLAGMTGAAFAAKTDVTIGMQLEPPNLDPTASAAAAIDEVVYANVFEGLTRIGPDGEVLPALAQAWEISADGLVYTFHLASGVTFHDGTTFDAEDVKFSLNRARADDSTNAQKALFTDIVSVDIVDPATVRVTLDHPLASFLFNLGWGDAVIVAPESAADNATHPIGTGPFRFADWVKGDHVDLVRYPDYWQAPAKLDNATFKFISDPTAAFAAMMAGDIDAFPNFPAPETLAQFKTDPRFRVVVGLTEGETIMAMNNGKAPFDDLRVRRAMSYAVDRQAVIDGAMFGYGAPIGSHYSPADAGYIDLTGLYPHDPAKAKALLADAGYPDGFAVTLKLPPTTYARRGGEIIADQLKAVGVKVQIVNVEWAQWLSDVFTDKDFDLTIISHTEPADIGIYARDDYYFDYHSEVFKRIMHDLDLATDPTKRMELLADAQQRIAKDAVNVFLFEFAKLGVWNAKLKGLWTNEPMQSNDLTGVFWEE